MKAKREMSGEAYAKFMTLKFVSTAANKA